MGTFVVLGFKRFQSVNNKGSVHRKGIIYEVTASELTNLSGLYSVERKKKEKKQAILDWKKVMSPSDSLINSVNQYHQLYVANCQVYLQMKDTSIRCFFTLSTKAMQE